MALVALFGCRSTSDVSALPDAAPTRMPSSETPGATVAPAMVDAGSTRTLPPLPRRATPKADNACLSLLERSNAAEPGHHEIVRLPYSFRAFAGNWPPWTLCAPNDVSLSVEWGEEPRLGVHPDLLHGKVPDPSHPTETCCTDGMVEGWLMKERRPFTWGYDPTQKETGQAYVFVAWHAREGSDVSSSLVADLDEDEIFVPQLRDDRPWLAIIATLPYTQHDVDAEAEAIRARAVAAGFDGAAVLDTRQTANLFCCGRVVVAGRYAKEPDAASAVRSAKRWPTAYVKQGW